MVDNKLLRDVAEIIMGQSPPGSTYNETGNGLPFFQGVKDFNYRYPTIRVFCSVPSRVAKPGDILFSVRAPIGRVNIADRECAIGRGLSIIRANSQNDQRYIEFVLRLNESSWNAIEGGGSVFGNATRSDLESFLIPWPDFPAERRVVADILGALDDKIELNRRMNETLEGMARAIFGSWFVDFDPVRAKAAGQQPAGQQPAGLAPHIADLFPDAFEASELGEIPKGWEVSTFNSLANVNERSLGRTDPLDVIDYIEISKVMRGDISEIDRYERGTEPSRAKRRLRHGDTVLSTVRPDRGAHFLCLDPPETLIASTGFTVLSPKDGCWAFLYTALTRREIGETLGRLADGGAHPAIRPEVLGDLMIAIPGHPQLRQEFQRIGEPLYQKAARNRDQSRTLADLRDTLLPKLVSGELRVPDAERIMGRYY